MIEMEKEAEQERLIQRACQHEAFDMEANEFYVRSSVMAWGARVLEKALNGFGAGRRDKPVLCRCGRKMRSRGLRRKTIQTLLGPVTFLRAVYECRTCGASRVPADEALDVAGGGFSPGARRLMCRAGSRESFREGAEDLGLYGNFKTTAKDVERVAEATGRQIENWMQRQTGKALYHDAAGVVPPEAGPPVPVLYISYDGTGAPMRRNELAGRKGKQPDGSSKTREVKLGCVFTQTILDEEGRPVRDPDSTTYVGAIKTSDEFGYDIHGEAVRRGLRQAGCVVILTDGIAYNKSIAAEHFPGALHIIDLFHAREHLHKFMKLLPVAERTVQLENHWLATLDKGDVEAMAAQMRPLLPADDKTHKEAEDHILYFENNAEHMRYKKFREQGLFVGSGVVEAGCKTLIGKRLKQSGMFWTVKGANAIIAARCCQYSGRFEQFWEDRASVAAA